MMPKHSREGRTRLKALLKVIIDAIAMGVTVETQAMGAIVEIAAMEAVRCSSTDDMAVEVEASTHGEATPRVSGESLQPMLNSCVGMLRKGNVRICVCRHCRM